MSDETPTRNRILVISHDVVERQMAGPGIRYVELAAVLGQEFEVTLATPNISSDDSPHYVSSYDSPHFRVHPYRDWPSLAGACEAVDAIVTSGFTLRQFPQVAELGIPLAVDLYDPFPLENLVLFANRAPADQQASYEFGMQVLDALCAAGDFFVCAHERQRDWWLGILQAKGRVNPSTIGQDATLRRLIDEVPFGLPSRPFQPQGEGPKQSVRGLDGDTRLILWGGGIWDWLDPLTLIKAMPAVLEREPRARLLFPGTRHPNLGLVEMEMQRRARETAERLNLLGRVVFFGEWVPYDEWPVYLADADVAVSLHSETPESRFAAVRSRTLSYVWACLPMVVTEGDAASELVREHGLGRVVGYGNVAGVAEAILEVLAAGKEPYRASFQRLAPSLIWEQVAQPLVAFCRDPRRAADKRVAPLPSHSNGHEVALAEQKQHIEQLQETVRGYERGRFIRAMRGIEQLRRKLRGRE